MAKDVIGTCQLCFKNKVLIKGHILPRWSSRLSGKGDEYHLIVSDETREREMVGLIPQGPVTEYLFCKECDNEFGIGEQLLREMVHPTSKKRSCISPVKDFGIELKGELAINQFYLAMSGLLLKGHLAKDEMWKDFILSKKQRNLIFEGIQKSCLSQYFRVFIYKLYSLEQYKVGNFTDKISDIHTLDPFAFQYQLKPSLMQYGNFTTAFVFGGLILVIEVHPKGISDSDTLESAIIPISATDIRYLLDRIHGFSLENFRKHLTVPKLMAYKETMRKMPLDSNCPCKVYFTNENGVKVNRKFRDCCYGYWGFAPITA